MNASGVSLAGLAMAAAELPKVRGIVPLENPEVGNGATMNGTYTLEDVAELHLAAIRELPVDFSREFFVVGMSMGAMIAAVLATKFRSELPLRTRFRFLVTSPNSSANPAVTPALLDDWKEARFGDTAIFAKLLEPFFSETFRASRSAEFMRFVEYRARGENSQRASAFRRQTAALKAFRGQAVFAAVDQTECEFIGAAGDRIFGASHSAELRTICPESPHREISQAGHMVNLEAPQLFDPTFSIDSSALSIPYTS